MDRHDLFKWALSDAMRWAGLQHVTEVYGLLSADPEREEALGIRTKKDRQRMVPDFHVQRDAAGYVHECCGLAELKFLGAVTSHYRKGAQAESPVEIKARSVHAEYDDNARQLGPVAHARFVLLGRVRPLVAGGYGEFNKALHAFMCSMVEAKLRRDAKAAPAAYSMGISKLRRGLGLAAMRAQVGMILAGLQYVGPGGREAYARRGEVKVVRAEVRQALEAEWFTRFHKNHESVGGGPPRAGEGGPPERAAAAPSVGG